MRVKRQRDKPTTAKIWQPAARLMYHPCFPRKRTANLWQFYSHRGLSPTRSDTVKFVSCKDRDSWVCCRTSCCMPRTEHCTTLSSLFHCDGTANQIHCQGVDHVI